MRAMFYALALVCVATAVGAQAVAVNRPLRAGELIGAQDLGFLDIEVPDGFLDPRDLVGLEARVNIYPGRPIRAREVGMPTVVQRNAVVPLIFQRGGLTITLEGRALQQAGDGESVRVMNLSSRSTVTGIATASGAVVVH